MAQALPADSEVFLLSFAQLAFALAIDPTHQEYLRAQNEVLLRLATELDITQPQLLARSHDTYTVSYVQAGEAHLMEFPFEEIEDFI